MQIYKNAWFTRFARKEKISVQAILDAVDREEHGLIDANLGGGVIKQRIARNGQGKSGSYRSVVLFSKSDKAFFVYGFSKSAQHNIQDDELAQFKRAAKILFTLSDDQISQLIKNREFEEVSRNG
jgi:hypothetical protein